MIVPFRIGIFGSSDSSGNQENEMNDPFSNIFFGSYDSSGCKENEIIGPVNNGIFESSDSSGRKENEMNVPIRNIFFESYDSSGNQENEMNDPFSNIFFGSYDSSGCKENEIIGPVNNIYFEIYDSSGSQENKMNYGITVVNNKYLFNQETVIKSAKEEIKENKSTTISSKKEMNVGINIILPYNQETVKKSAKEENKESLSVCLLSKKKSKKEKEEIFIILKRKHYKDGKHNKFALDNMTRKLKVHLIESIRVLLNASLREDGNVITLFFVKIKQEIIRENGVEYNIYLLGAKIKDIFKNVGKKYKKYNNEELIKKFENKETKTSKILEKTFLQCLKHFRGSEKYEELAGLENEYNNVIDQLRNKGEKEENIEKFKKFVEGFEENKKIEK